MIFILCVNSHAYAEDKQGQLVDKQKYEWVVEEILQQITELRKEINSLKKDVAAVSSKVDALSKAGPIVADRNAPQSVQLGSYRLGDENAGYAIVEFTDYQCPYCGRHAKDVLPQIKKQLIDTGKVQYAMRDYPLSFHGEAKNAAVAARCAGAQDRYWAMHAQLFAHRDKLNVLFYQESAKTLGLDEADFTHCMNDPKQGEAVDRDLAYGNSLGVSGTPKFFVGKVKGDVITDVQVISGAQAYGAFSGALERLN